MLSINKILMPSFGPVQMGEKPFGFMFMLTFASNSCCDSNRVNHPVIFDISRS